MKLAEALILRADHQRRIQQLRARLAASAKVQEGDAPAEDPLELLAELDRTIAALGPLIQRINRTNMLTELEPGVTISDALAERDMLQLRHVAYRELAQQSAITQTRYSRSEVRFVSTVDVAGVQAQADDLARQHRELDTRIQEANWLTELVE